MTGAAFITTTDVPWVTIGPGLTRQVMGHGPDLMLVRVEFAKGAVGVTHHHPHRQVSYVVAGSFEVTVNGETRVLKEGDCFYVAADLVHGAVALEKGTLIDVFTPAREEFLK